MSLYQTEKTIVIEAYVAVPDLGPISIKLMSLYQTKKNKQ